MSQTWTLGSRVSRWESRTTQRRKVRPTCGETGGKLKRVHHCSKAHRTKTFLSRRFLDIRLSRPGEVLWDTGAQEGLVWKQQLDKWCKLLAEDGLQVEWSQEKPESASGIGGMMQPIGVVYVPVGLAGCNGIIRFTVVEQDVPPPLPVVIMRTLQVSLDLADDGDKVIFRQFGGESSLRTLQSGHTVIRADQFDPDGWQHPEITELGQDNDEGSIAHVYQGPRFMDNDTSAGDHAQHPNAVAGHGRRQHQTTTDLRDLTRQSLPHHHLGSRAVNKRTVLFKTMGGIYGRALNATSSGETTRHGTLWTIKQWKRLAHYMVYVRCAAFFDTLSREFLMLIPMGRSEDIRLALRRREQREMKDKKSNIANLLQAPWLRGKAVPRGNWGTPWKKAPNDCDHPPTAIQKGGNAAMYYERCEICGNRWQRIPLTMVARDPETTLNNRTVLASTGRRPVEIERPFCPHGHGNMMTQATPQQSLYWECSTCSTTSGLSLDGCDVQLADRESRGCRREHGSHWGRRNTVPLNVQEQLKDVDQEVYLQLFYEIGQRPENKYYDPWTCVETESGVGRTGDRAF